MVGKKPGSIITIWLSRPFWGIFIYRVERSLFLIFGRFYSILRIVFIPLFNLIYAYSNVEIHYQADIKEGLLILHTSPGIIISRFTVAGRNLILTGGNIIGEKPGCGYGDIQIGNDCFMGANAVILGPVKLADHIQIGALACVVNDCLTNNLTLIGVPAKEIVR